jgi:transposase
VVRLVLEHDGEYGTQWAATENIIERIACSPEAHGGGVRQVERSFRLGLGSCC